MAERYMRYVTEITGGASAAQVYEAPNNGSAAAADSVIIGFLICSRSTSAGTVTVEILDYATNGTGLTQKTIGIADTIPLPADTSVDIIPGKLVLQHAGNNESTPVLKGDKINMSSTQDCDVTISVVERV
jgi:hypothetical protein